MVGSSPRHAGNSRAGACRAPASSDHPRACGELARYGSIFLPGFGSSPRMRGTRSLAIDTRWLQRIIPAHAGNSRRCCSPARVGPDHPRACGELAIPLYITPGPVGSSPRMRGTRFPGSVQHDDTRIIPAHAGNSATGVSRACGRPDHPRACGELCGKDKALRSAPGSSPRMRGTRFP